MKKLNLITMFLLCFTTTVVSSAVHAQEPSLFFAPTRVEISDKDPVTEIRVTNVSDFARAYNISVENIVMGNDGVTRRVENFDYSAKRMIRFVPRQFVIEPGGKQIIRIMGRFASNTEDGDYHAHMEFLENVQRREELNQDVKEENRARMKAGISYAAAIPVILTKGEVKTDVGMESLQLSSDKENRPVVSMNLTRSGNGQGNVFLEADYIAADGTTTKAAVRRTIFVYREIDKRQYNFVMEQLKTNDLQSGGRLDIKLFNRDVSVTEPVQTLSVPVS